MRTTLALAALVAVVLAGARCKRVNGAYCDDSRPCPNGFACDLTARECHDAPSGGGDLGGGNIDMAGCNCSATTPICVAMSCVSCLSTSDPEGACAAVSPSTPHCMTMGSDAGACVGCRDSSDCGGTTPFCDATSHVCRGCIADGECPSLICDLTPGSMNHGQCVDTSKVVYADGVNGNDGNMGLTPATATKTIQHAINNAVGANPLRAFVHVAAATYNENVGVNNKTIYVVGADGAIIHPANNDGLGSMGATGSLTVRNLIVTATNGNGANCQGAALTAYRTQFVGSKQNGVFAMNCALLLDADWIDSNLGSGIYIQSGDFTVINSIITRNSNQGGVYQLIAGNNPVFANNTVADNTASGTVAGVSCASAMSISVRNSILYDNKGTAGSTIGETNCTSEFDASDDAVTGPQSTVDLTLQPPGFKGGAPVTSASYHLTSTSPCRHQASPQYAPDHDFDFAPRSSTMPDIGADEAP